MLNPMLDPILDSFSGPILATQALKLLTKKCKILSSAKCPLSNMKTWKLLTIFQATNMPLHGRPEGTLECEKSFNYYPVINVYGGFD